MYVRHVKSRYGKADRSTKMCTAQIMHGVADLDNATTSQNVGMGFDDGSELLFAPSKLVSGTKIDNLIFIYF